MRTPRARITLSRVDAVSRPRRRPPPCAPHRIDRSCRDGAPSPEAVATCSASRRLLLACRGALAGDGRFLLLMASSPVGGMGRPRWSGRVVLRLALALLAPWAVLARDGRVVLCTTLPAVDAVSRPRQRRPRRAPHGGAPCWRRQLPSPEMPRRAPHQLSPVDAVSRPRRSRPPAWPSRVALRWRVGPLSRTSGILLPPWDMELSPRLEALEVGVTRPTRQLWGQCGRARVARRRDVQWRPRPGGAGSRCGSEDMLAAGPGLSCSGRSALGGEVRARAQAQLTRCVAAVRCCRSLLLRCSPNRDGHAAARPAWPSQAPESVAMGGPGFCRPSSYLPSLSSVEGAAPQGGLHHVDLAEA